MVGLDGVLHEILRPHVDAVSAGIAAMIEVASAKRISLGKDIGDAVSPAGLHSV